MRLGGACLQRPISINFLVFLVKKKKIQRINTLKVEHVTEMKFLSGK